MVELVKWTLVIVAIMMTYLVMNTAVANASVAPYAGIIHQIVI